MLQINLEYIGPEGLNVSFKGYGWGSLLCLIQVVDMYRVVEEHNMFL